MSFNVDYTDRVHGDPDWIIVGARRASDVCVLASQHLGHATLVAHLKAREFWAPIEQRLAGSTYRLDVEAREVIMTTGADYREALMRLFEAWGPDSPAPPTLDAPPPVTQALTAQRRRIRSCVEAWPDCEEGAYHPSCCRFPKSCSCTVYDDDLVDDGDLVP